VVWNWLELKDKGSVQIIEYPFQHNLDPRNGITDAILNWFSRRPLEMPAKINL